MMRYTQWVGRVVVLGLLAGWMTQAQAQPPAPQQSKSGPMPGKGVVSPKANLDAKNARTLTGVPAYLWRHGCGPTAIGMVLGYWDSNGYPDLIPGRTETQTAAVDQAIASGGNEYVPSPTPKHFEDYAAPVDYYPDLLDDDYITQSRTPHVNDCIADFADTSKSTRSNYYGWAWSSDIGPAFSEYIALVAPAYTATIGNYYWDYAPALTFDIVKNEIDNGRPMVFLVDSDGDDSTDHFITIVGYNDGPPQTYLYLNTWDHEIHEAQFRGMSSSYAWGVWGGWTVSLAGGNAFSAYIDDADEVIKKVGDPLRLEVVAVDTAGSVSYQWRKNGKDIENANDAVYAVNAVTVDDAGSYTCRVDDESKSFVITDPVTVSVYVNKIPVGDASTELLVVMLLMLGGYVLAPRRV